MVGFPLIPWFRIRDLAVSATPQIEVVLIKQLPGGKKCLDAFFPSLKSIFMADVLVTKSTFRVCRSLEKRCCMLGVALDVSFLIMQMF